MHATTPLRFLGLAAALLAAQGCAARLLDTPPHFLELEEADLSEYDYRATTADGVVLAARRLEHDSERGGDLSFWVDVTSRRMREQEGYALLEQRDVKTRRGLAGKQLRFGRDDKGKTYRYWLTVFVTDDALYLVEAGGPEARFATREAVLETAIASLRH
jgi:hypothetical protein